VKTFFIVLVLLNYYHVLNQECSSDLVISPKENIYSYLDKELLESKSSIKVCVFIFDYKPLADLLIKAKNAEIDIDIITDFRSLTLPMRDDSTTYNETVISYLFANDINPYIYKGLNSSIMHHKFVLIDGRKVLIGSYNFQKEAQLINHENLVLIQDEKLNVELGNFFNELKKDKSVYQYENLNEILRDFYFEYGITLIKSGTKFFLKFLSIPLILIITLFYFYRHRLKIND